MTDSRYKKYEDCTLEELENIVEDLENMSIAALKNKKIDNDCFNVFFHKVF